MKRLVAVLVASGLTFFAGTGSVAAAEQPAPPGSSNSRPDATPLERVNAYVQPSVVYEALEWKGWVYDTFNKQYLNDGQPFTITTQCTGFVVNPEGYIATAGHCVDPKGDILTLFAAEAAQWALDTGYYATPDLALEDILAFDDYRIEGANNKSRPDLTVTVAWGASASGIETTEQKAARVISLQPFDKGDAALLKVEASELNAIDLATDAEVGVGTEVVSIGYPASVDLVTDADFSPSYKEGSISSVKTIQGGLLTVYEISAAVSGGMSGGPTVNLDGQVVGINSFGITGEEQQFNFVRPADMVTELMAGAGVENELSATSRQYRRGLDAYFAGNKPVAVKALRAVAAEQASNDLAQQYLDKARDLPDPVVPEESGGFPFVLLGVGLVLLVGLGGGVALVLLRRRQPRPPAPAGGAPAFPVEAPASGPAAAPVSGPEVAPLTGPAAAPTPAVSPPQERTSAGFTAVPRPPEDGVTAPLPGAVAVEPTADANATPEAHAFCTSCGTKAALGQRFCGGCGAAL